MWESAEVSKFTSHLTSVVCPDVATANAYCFHTVTVAEWFCYLHVIVDYYFAKEGAKTFFGIYSAYELIYLSKNLVTGGPFSPSFEFEFCPSRLCCLFSVIIPPTDLSIISCILRIVSSLDLRSSLCFCLIFSISLSLSIITVFSRSISTRRESAFELFEPFWEGFFEWSKSVVERFTLSLLGFKKIVN